MNREEEFYQEVTDTHGVTFPVGNSDNRISALWSETCVLAYYMKWFHDGVFYRSAGPSPRMISYSSKPPCDFPGRSNSQSIRYCSTLVQAIRMRERPFDTIQYPPDIMRDWLYFTESRENDHGQNLMLLLPTNRGVTAFDHVGLRRYGNTALREFHQ